MSRHGSANATARPPGATRLARALLIATIVAAAAGAGCASRGAVPQPFPTPGDAPDIDRATPGGRQLAETALAFRGAAYRAGGSDPSGFDCSGFVQYVLGQHGIAGPRQVRDQFRMGRSVPSSRLQPGDLVFFVTEGRWVSHVGIAVGRGHFVHAPSRRGTVRVESLDDSYWRRRFAGARRLDMDGAVP